MEYKMEKSNNSPNGDQNSLRKGKERHPSFPEGPEGRRHLCSVPVRIVIVTEHQFIPLTLWLERTEEQGPEMLGRQGLAAQAGALSPHKPEDLILDSPTPT